MARVRWPSIFSATLLAVLTTSCGSIGSRLSADDTPGRIHIASQPPSATVYIMGAPVGVTPMTVSDREIYPVSYNMDVEKYYGKVILRKAGCEDFSRRLTRQDVRKGLVATLRCDGDGQGVSQRRSPVAPSAVSPQRQHLKRVPSMPAATADQRLQQLQMLQRLRDQGVLGDDQEERLRRRVLEAQ